MRYLDRPRALGTAVAILAGLASILAPSASATVLPGSVGGSVQIGRAGKNRHYELRIKTPGDDAAILFVEDKQLSEVPFDLSNRYAVRPSSPLSSGTLGADFGAIGTVSLRFHPEESATGTVRKGCRGRAPRTERGTYRGTIDLRGERGIFSVHRIEALGVRRRRFRLECTDATPSPPTSRPLAAYAAPILYGDETADLRLELLSESPERTLGLLAQDFPTGTHSQSEAADLEEQPDMAIGRYALIAAPLVFGPVPSEGPTPPGLNAMLGGVKFNADPAAPATWSGEVRQNFLGGFAFLMNGPASRTRLCPYELSPEQCVGDPDPLLSVSPF